MTNPLLFRGESILYYERSETTCLKILKSMFMKNYTLIT